MQIKKSSIKHIPGVRWTARNTRRGLNDLICAALQHTIAARKGHDILVLLGMRRSGNHLAINWILEQTQGVAVFYNNIRAPNHPFTATMKEYRLRLPNTRPRIILSYEDMTPEEMAIGPLPDFLRKRIQEQGARVQFGLVLRDPFNLFASRLKKWPDLFVNDEYVAEQKALYICHAGLVKAPVPLFGEHPLIPIIYNHLITNSEYRKSLSLRLGISNGTKGMDTVPVYGHGSSFEGFSAETNNIQNRVFERWVSMRCDPQFRHITNDPRIRDYGSELFGMNALD